LVDLPLCDFHPHRRPLFVIQAAHPAGPTLKLRRLPNSCSSLGCAQKSVLSPRNRWMRTTSRPSNRISRRRKPTRNSRKERRARARKATSK
ncbi:hypothetical protein DXG01_000784, partial [Tephrocybe rancida]